MDKEYLKFYPCSNNNNASYPISLSLLYLSLSLFHRLKTSQWNVHSLIYYRLPRVWNIEHCRHRRWWNTLPYSDYSPLGASADALIIMHTIFFSFSFVSSFFFCCYSSTCQSSALDNIVRIVSMMLSSPDRRRSMFVTMQKRTVYQDGIDQTTKSLQTTGKPFIQLTMPFK